jgi:hypothetical protein
VNVEIGTEAGQFLFWEYINGILVALRCQPHASILINLFSVLITWGGGGEGVANFKLLETRSQEMSANKKLLKVPSAL